MKKRNPMLTKNDRVRLGPLNKQQLETLLKKTAKPKDKDKIQRRLNILK